MRTEDGYIIQKCLDGDAAAFGLLVDKYKGSVYALAYTKLGNFHDAQDITQEVFLKAYQKLRTLKQCDKFLSWLYAITSNSCKDFLRSKASRPDGEYVADQEQECLDKISICSYQEDEIHLTLQEALSELPEIHRQVLTLHYLGGMSCREIARFLGASPHAIAMRLNRARAKLKKEMLTMMDTSFEQQKLHPAITLNIVEAIQRTRIQSSPQTPAVPIGIAAVSLLTFSMLCLIVPFDQVAAIGKLIGTPLPSETKVADIGEIPVDVVMLSDTSVISSGDGKKDLMKNSQPTNEVRLANAHTEVDTNGRNEPTARLGNGVVTRLAYSPDGKLIAVMGAIGIWIYDAESLTEVGMIARGARTIAFSPDGRTLASGHRDRTIYLWDVSTQKPVGSLLFPGRRGVTTLSYSLDGKTLAVGYGNGNIALWDTATQQKTALLDTDSSILWTLAFSPDGKLLASGGCENPEISLWDVQTRTLMGSFDGHPRLDGWVPDSGVSSVAFSPDGKTLASGSVIDGTLRLWDVANRAQIALLSQSDTDELEDINDIAFSPNGAILASASDDDTIRLWDVHNQMRLGVINTNAGGVTSIAFRPDGKTLASLNCRRAATAGHKGGDMALRLWSVRTRRQIAAVQNHTAAIESVALSPDGSFLASAHHDGIIGLWDMQTQKRIATLRGHKAAVRSVVFSPDGTLLASGGRDRARLWNVRKRRQVVAFKHKVIVEAVAFSPDGKTLATVDESCIRLWDTRRKRAVGVLGQEPSRRGTGFWDRMYSKWILREDPVNWQPHVSIIQAIAFSPDGTLLASGGIDNTFRLWNVQQRQEIFTHKQTNSGNIFAVAFSPDGNSLASAGTEKEVHLWHVGKRKLTGSLKVSERIKALAYSPDGRFLAAAVGGEVSVWDMKNQAEVLSLDVSATSIVFSHDGKTLVAGSLDGTIRIWDTAGFGNE
ncbi:MAG: sigma-70 family RNA polymerase sigma factor [Candidatus Poribacteria bacterium]|nr:sigma-70 family RNA polymerase sigma factor [Candidatus Poribacteria bacterium]